DRSAARLRRDRPWPAQPPQGSKACRSAHRGVSSFVRSKWVRESRCSGRAPGPADSFSGAPTLRIVTLIVNSALYPVKRVPQLLPLVAAQTAVALVTRLQLRDALVLAQQFTRLLARQLAAADAGADFLALTQQRAL